MGDRQALVDEIGDRLEDSGATVLRDVAIDPNTGEIVDSGQPQQGTQARMSLCMTCSGLESEHPEEGGCNHCDHCPEFWPHERQFEDGLEVLGHEIGLSGSVSIGLTARVPYELWEQMRTDNEVRLTLDCVVVGKGYAPHKSDGVVVGLIEQRKLKARRLVLSRTED